MSNENLQQQLLTSLRVSSELMKRAQAAEEKLQKLASAINSEIPATVDALVSGGRITADEKDSVSHGLQDPVTGLQLMRKLAFHRNDKETVEPIGKPVGKGGQVKTANARYLGEHVADWDETNGGRAFRDILMGSV